jgi:hypothetical protein
LAGDVLLIIPLSSIIEDEPSTLRIAVDDIYFGHFFLRLQVFEQFSFPLTESESYNHSKRAIFQGVVRVVC